MISRALVIAAASLALAVVACSDSGSDDPVDSGVTDTVDPVDGSGGTDAKNDITEPKDITKPDIEKPVDAGDTGSSDTGADVEEPDTSGDTGETDVVAPPAGACADWVATKRAYYGDLHVHTKFSFDSYSVGNTQNDPKSAYAFAKGEEVFLPPFDGDGKSTRTLQLGRPLDFVALTEHSEYIGEVSICLDPEAKGYNSITCINFRNFSDFEAELGGDISFIGWGTAIASDDPQRLDFCENPGVDCEAAAAGAWSQLQGMANDAYEPCDFTALHGYEWTATISAAMTHRNIIFRTEVVPDAPISFFEVQKWDELAQSLRDQCDAVGNGCDVLAIPHNPNYSEGNLFMPTNGDGSPLDAAAAKLRQEMEVAVELTQTKQESECRNGFANAPGAEDEYCNFEKLNPRSRFCDPGEVPCTGEETPDTAACAYCLRECAPGESVGCTAPWDYARGFLASGLQQEATLGVNPFKLGFVGGTDTHNATPGAVAEQTFEGHHGASDNTLDEHLYVPEAGGFIALAADANPGGLAAVWAEQNTREAIFDAIRRRETFATTGTRISARAFGGWGFEQALCDDVDLAAKGYAGGVPMGGSLSGADAGDASPRFVVQAMRDPGDAQFEGALLQQVHIIKIWLDADDIPHEQVYDITPNKDYSATVNTDTCVVSGPGFDTICAVWEDPDFDASESATYYARILENPTCRWHNYKCISEADSIDCVTDPLNACCTDDVPKTIQERAWTSPIWYEP